MALTTLRALYGLPPILRIDPGRSALLLVDFQAEFFEGQLPLPAGRVALEHAARLARWAREAGIWVVHVRQLASRPDSLLFAPGGGGVEPMPELTPRSAERVLVKHLAGAFSRTELDVELRARGIDTLVVAGLMTHLAVAVTASDATVLGYRVIVAAEATATRALPGALGGADLAPERVQLAALAMLADRMAQILTTEEIVGLPRGAYDPAR